MIKTTTTNSLNNKIQDYFEQYLKKEINVFEDFSEVSDITKRNLHVNDIEEETGPAIETFIRLFNQIDEEMNIPIEQRIPIKLWINSNGGDLHSGFTICDAIKLSKTPIITINTGKAFSCGALIFLCGDKRLTFPNAAVLIHEGSIGSFQADANKFQNMSDFYKEQRAVLKDIIINNSKISEELYDSHSKDDWWITAAQSIELGIADRFITSEEYYNL